MNGVLIFRQRLRLMLAILIVITIGGVILAGFFCDIGLIAVMIGVPACYPVLVELLRIDDEYRFLKRM